MRESLLVNTLGHAAGVLIFSIFVSLLLRDRAATRLRGSRQSLLAAGLALVWNLTSLIILGFGDSQSPAADLGFGDSQSPAAGLGFGDSQSPAADAMVTVSFSVLSLLPAVLFDLCLVDRYRRLVAAGYALSVIAIGMHIAEPFAGPELFHRWALTLITIGFGALAGIAAILVLASGEVRKRGTTSRILGTMALFLLSMSFVHFGGVKHIDSAWSQELAFHHAGIPLALLVLLQDYRFLLLDAFVRFLANVTLAAAFTIFGVSVARQFGMPDSRDGFAVGLWLVAICLVLILFAMSRSLVQSLLTRLAFGRTDFDRLLVRLKAHETAGGAEPHYLERVGDLLANFLRAPVRLADGDLHSALSRIDLHYPTPVSDLGAFRPELEAQGTEVVTPVRLLSGEAHFLLLGRRLGGRRYLSEEVQALARAASVVAEQMDAQRDAEMRRLVSQAELRALQSQIHPHFLFNALNTLYGLIPREAGGARRTVLNLADIFRYFLRTEQTMRPLEDELQIVEAYLEIEKLRLGDKLRTEIDVDEEARRTLIPVLSVQPLVENAIKYGVAPNPNGGVVRLIAKTEASGLRLRIEDSGAGNGVASDGGSGVGLENVRRRLKLCYGEEADLQIVTGASGTTVLLTIPLVKEVLR